MRLALACAAGFAVLYAIGLPYIALIVNVYNGGAVSAAKLATAYMLPYLPGDCLKIVVSVLPCPAYSQGNGKKFIKILPQSCKCNFAKLQILCYTKLTKASNLKIPTKIKWRIRI